MKLSPAQRLALQEACRLGQLMTFYSSWKGDGVRIHSSRTVQALVDKGLMTASYPTARPTEAGRAALAQEGNS
jgi:hypothetical protein